MTTKQCTCGRSLSYPYCDNTHKLPASPVINVLNKHNFLYLKDGDSPIVEIPKFISNKFSKEMVLFFEKQDSWSKVGFHKAETLDVSSLINGSEISEGWDKLIDTIKRSAEIVFGKSVINQTTYVQRWPEGSYGTKHNDTYNDDGTIGNISYKVASTIFLNNTFEGGRLEFPDHELSISPNYNSMYLFNGGPENEHQISIIESGVRYTIVSFWDFEDSVYTEEEINAVNKSREYWAKYVEEME